MSDTSTPRIRLLIVSGCWPHFKGSSEAANIIAYSILTELVSTRTFDISFAYVNSSSAPVPAVAEPELQSFRDSGVTFLPPLLIGNHDHSILDRISLFARALTTDPAHILHGYGTSHLLLDRLSSDIDAVLSIWTEIGFYAASGVGRYRFSYHGNPDHKVFDAQYEILRLSNTKTSLVGFFRQWLRATIYSKLIERAHLSVMRRYNMIANVAANDAFYYSRKGVNAFYLPNMWPNNTPIDWETSRNLLEPSNPGKIIGSVGNLSATGNTLGFLTLGHQILPALDRTMPPDSFKIHIYGGRELRPFILPLLTHPAVIIRGFVQNLDEEILSAPVFLICNNHNKFKVGHTRILHAWSLGACVVAFRDCRESMPEIEHNRNALLADNADELAHLIFEAFKDHSLRRRIGRGGHETLQKSFSPPEVTRRLIERMHLAGLPLTRS